MEWLLSENLNFTSLAPQSGNDNIKENNHFDNNYCLLSTVFFCMLFYSRVTNYVIFGHCASTFQMSEHCVGVPLVLSQGWVHACVWACSILLCPGFQSCSDSCFPGPAPVLLTPKTSRGERKFGNKWLSGSWIKNKEWYPQPSLPPVFLSLYICVVFGCIQVWVYV